jgi:DNA-binding MarR family transcriptional regulator
MSVEHAPSGDVVERDPSVRTRLTGPVALVRDDRLELMRWVLPGALVYLAAGEGRTEGPYTYHPPTYCIPVPAFTPQPLHALPSHLFRRLHQQSVALYSRHAEGSDLTPVQYAALHAIGAWPDSDQVGIGRAIACDKATMGSVLDRLQAKGLAERVADASDRRSWRLRLTPAGEEQLERLAPRVAQLQDELLAPLSAAERRQLTALLERLLGQLPTPGAGR